MRSLSCVRLDICNLDRVVMLCCLSLLQKRRVLLVQGIQQVCDCTITIQIDNCPIASQATQMGPMPVHVIALYVGPMP